MVNGVVLLVDAFDGPMPQTRFVLQKALELNHKVIIVVNKIDRPDARPEEVTDEVLELLLELDATDEQLDSPVIYCSGRAGTASTDPYTQGDVYKRQRLMKQQAAGISPSATGRGRKGPWCQCSSKLDF